jgi:hypothetical protein
MLVRVPVPRVGYDTPFKNGPAASVRESAPSASPRLPPMRERRSARAAGLGDDVRGVPDDVRSEESEDGDGRVKLLKRWFAARPRHPNLVWETVAQTKKRLAENAGKDARRVRRDMISRLRGFADLPLDPAEARRCAHEVAKLREELLDVEAALIKKAEE